MPWSLTRCIGILGRLNYMKMRMTRTAVRSKKITSRAVVMMMKTLDRGGTPFGDRGRGGGERGELGLLG